MRVVGRVTKEEKDEIYDLFEKYNALCNLRKIVSTDDVLNERLQNELEDAGKKQSDWWNIMAQKYQWDSEPDKNWIINFLSNEICLV